MYNKIKHYLAPACHIWLTTVHFILSPIQGHESKLQSFLSTLRPILRRKTPLVFILSGNVILCVEGETETNHSIYRTRSNTFTVTPFCRWPFGGCGVSIDGPQAEGDVTTYLPAANYFFMIIEKSFHGEIR